MVEAASDDGTPQSPDERALRVRPARVGAFLLAVAAAVFLLPYTEADPETAEGLTAQVLVRENAGAIEGALGEMGAKSDDPMTLRVDYRGRDGGEEIVLRELEQLSSAELVEADESPPQARLVFDVRSERDRVEVTARLESEGEAIEAFEAERLMGRWTAILPPLIAVLVALFFRRLLIALGLAVWLGSALQTSFDPIESTWMGLETYLWGSVADTFNLYIIAFTFSLVGMVQVITRMGGMQGVLDVFAHLAKSARSTKVATAMVGLAIFFDDYANTIVTGTTMRPMADKRRISREKLAYLVDSTAAPIAGIAIISTWIGYEVGLFDTLAGQLGLGQSGYEIFFAIIPLRFYCIFALVFVFLNAFSGRDFGPMRAAEERARETGQVLRPGSTPLTSSAISDIEPADGVDPHWRNAVVPIVVVIVGTVGGMYWSGWTGPGEPGSIPGLDALLFGSQEWPAFFAAWARASGGLADFEAWRDAFSAADNAKVLFWAALTGSAVAVAMATTQKLLSFREAVSSWLKAIPAMWLAVAILVLAWAIQAVCGDLGTGIYLVGAVQDIITPVLLPLLTFLLAAVVAFATGTSWGTMGMLLPALIPLAFFMTQGMEGGLVILLLCFGAVLDGAIFGDHCSPISDTTVMSSIASSVDHIDHVRTQFPYAVTVMIAAAGLGYVGVAMGLPVLLAHLIGIAALAGALFALGR